MEVVGAVVDGEIVLFTVDCEFTLADAVAVAAYQCAEEWLGAVE